MEQLPELSSYLAEIQKNGENSVAPIEKLKSLLATLNPSHTADWDKFKDIFSSFESGEIDSTNAWNQSVARIKEIEAQAAESHQKLLRLSTKRLPRKKSLIRFSLGNLQLSLIKQTIKPRSLKKKKSLCKKLPLLKKN